MAQPPAKRMEPPYESDKNQDRHVRRRTSHPAVGSDFDQAAEYILRQLAERGVCQVAHDNITDEDHAQLDQAVTERIAVYKTETPFFTREMVVAAVVETCDRMDQKYANYEEQGLATFLLDTGNGRLLRRLVDLALSNESYKYIRRLEYLHPTQKPSYIALEQVRAAEYAWGRRFDGDHHKVLSGTIRELYEEVGHKYYGNILPIVQSSGTGKSRVAREAAGLIFSLVITIRDPKDVTAYPPSDLTAHSYLTRREATVRHQQYAYEVFLCEWFKAARDELLEFRKGVMFPSMASLAMEWRTHMENGGRERILDRALENVEEMKRKYVSRQLSGSRQSKVATSSLCEAIKSRLTLSEPGVLLTVYVDEVAALSHEATEDSNRNLYDIFLSAWVRATEKEPAFLITLATNSTLSLSAPPLTMFSSARAVSPDARHNAPFTELVFDTRAHGEYLFTRNQHTLSDVADVKYMIRFGRPLWRALYESSSADPVDIVEFALAKLACCRPAELESNAEGNPKREARIAIVSTRVLFDIEPAHSAYSRTEAELVASHMRIAFSVPTHRAYMRSGTPSEPILAEAAAKAMNEFNIDAIGVVGDALKSGLIDKGARGELVARLLLIMAYDDALKALHAREGSRVISYSRAVPVCDFLRALVAQAYTDDVLGCKPDGADEAAASLEEAFDGAFVRFSHFGRNGLDNTVDTRAGLAAVARGMAIQCCQNQAAIDIAIPIVLKDEKLQEGVMSMMLIQVKDRANRVPLPDITAESLDVFPPASHTINGEPDHRPYIAMTMQLGVVSSRKRASPSENHRIHVRTRAVAARDTKNPSMHPRYYINIEGCSHKVYGVLKSPDDTGRFGVLLAAHPLLDEHPRQSLRRNVEELKLEWSRNRSCYGWTDDDGLWGDDEEPTAGES